MANPQVRHFWLREFESYPRNLRADSIAPLQNKVGAFLTDPVLNQILTQPKSSFDVRHVIDSGQILLVNVAKGKVGEDSAALLGSLLLTKLAVAALSRTDLIPEARKDFFIYLDEFYTFTTLSIATMLSELRKYNVGMVLAHQYLSQLAVQVRDAILGNIGTVICFRLGALDAAVWEQEFGRAVSASDLMALPNYEIYLKLLVNGYTTSPFSAQTILPAS